MSKLKDSLYDEFVRKNGRVWYEYERYVREHMEEYHLNRFARLRVLWKLNWFYRVKKGNTPYLYWDVPLNPNVKNKIIAGSSKENGNEESKRTTLTNSKEINEKCISESQVDHRPAPFHFAIDLLQYDVISFDIFDTLVLRPFKNPTDLFNLVGYRLNYPTVFNGFKQARINAELLARNTREQKLANREVNIYEIYDELSKGYGVDKEVGIRCEIETELDYVKPNPYMKIVFDILKAQGKRIVLTSDMYLPEILIAQIVNKCGYSGAEKIYVSCDYRVNKRSGDLFKRVSNDFKNLKIVHVGDNIAADIEGARKAGLDARYYKNVNDAGKDYRPNWMAELTESAYSGLVNAYIHNGARKYPFFYEYGFIYGGIYVLGFCNWIAKKVKQEQIDKIIFLSRDGDIYQKVYNKYFMPIKNDYIFWSRFANLKYLIEINQEAFIDRVVKQKALGTLNVEVKSILDSFGINVSEKKLKKYGLYFDSIVTSRNRVSLEKFIKDNWNVFLESFSLERSRIIDEIKPILGDAKRIAVIDVGWTGSGPIGFKSFVEKYISADYEIKCWMAGGAGSYGSSSGVIPQYLAESIESYMFSPLHNKRNAQIHTSENVAVTNNAVFELFTQTQYPSFKGIDAAYNYMFDIPEVENFSVISQIHKGILDFTDLYIRTFEKDSYLYNISGFDAYRPFAKKAFEKSFFEKNFADITNAYGLSGDNSNQQIETIGQRMHHYYANQKGQ